MRNGGDFTTLSPRDDRTSASSLFVCDGEYGFVLLPDQV
jgi:hypothetical protein